MGMYILAVLQVHLRCQLSSVLNSQVITLTDTTASYKAIFIFTSKCPNTFVPSFGFIAPDQSRQLHWPQVKFALLPHLKLFELYGVVLL